jgi:hypothetical protein
MPMHNASMWNNVELGSAPSAHAPMRHAGCTRACACCLRPGPPRRWLVSMHIPSTDTSFEWQARCARLFHGFCSFAPKRRELVKSAAKEGALHAPIIFFDIHMDSMIHGGLRTTGSRVHNFAENACVSRVFPSFPEHHACMHHAPT